MDYTSSLPHEVLVKIFSGLAAPNFLCASASVCPSWREAAKDPYLWRELYVNNAPLNSRLTGPRLRNLVARSHNTLTRLWLIGCPLVIDAVLVLPLQQQPCLVYVRVTDCALVTRPGLAHALCNAEDFQGVVEQLNDPRQSAADAQRCCVALRTLLSAEDEEAALAEAQTAGTLDALLHCAALHAAHSGVQAACCFALSRYVCAAQDTEVASYPPVFQAAVAALKAHPLDVNVQGAALFALRNVCCYGLEGTPGVPALLDAVQPVLAALRAFPTDLTVQQYGCDSLALMCEMDASVAEPVAAAGAMRLFIKALNLDIIYDNTCIAAVVAIGAIALAPAALPQATAGIDAVVRTLRQSMLGNVIALAACKTLGATCILSPRASERCALVPTQFAQSRRSTEPTLLSARLPRTRCRLRRHEPGKESISRKERAAPKRHWTRSTDAAMYPSSPLTHHCQQSGVLSASKDAPASPNCARLLAAGQQPA